MQNCFLKKESMIYNSFCWALYLVPEREVCCDRAVGLYTRYRHW